MLQPSFPGLTDQSGHGDVTALDRLHNRDGRSPFHGEGFPGARHALSPCSPGSSNSMPEAGEEVLDGRDDGHLAYTGERLNVGFKEVKRK